MIVEIRTYRIRPGMREDFLEFFRREAVPLQRSLGIHVTGPFLDVEDPDVVVWMRSFPSLAERDWLKSQLYDGEKWTRELRDIVMPMLSGCYSRVTQIPEWFVEELGKCVQS